MITLCWAAKGGSGTTVVAATRALVNDQPTLLVDLAGDLPLVLGVGDPEGPGIGEWLRSEAPADRLRRLEIAVDDTTSLVPAGAAAIDRSSDSDGEMIERWRTLVAHLVAEDRDIVVDAGTGVPPPSLCRAADRCWLVTRACYLALRAAVAQQSRPDGIILVAEPGRSLRRRDLELSLGAPVVAEVLLDPAVARAADAGLLAARLPGIYRRRLGEAA